MSNPEKPYSSLRCRKCQDIITSTYTHDFKRCSCGAVFVDGGQDYMRFGWPNGDYRDYVEILSSPDDPAETESLQPEKG